MKTLLPFAAALLVFIAVSCDTDPPPPQSYLDMIAGDGQKVWRISATISQTSTSYLQLPYHPDTAHATVAFSRDGKVYYDYWENGEIVRAYKSPEDWRFYENGPDIIFTIPTFPEVHVEVKKLTPDSLVIYQLAFGGWDVYVPK